MTFTLNEIVLSLWDVTIEVQLTGGTRKPSRKSGRTRSGIVLGDEEKARTRNLQMLEQRNNKDTENKFNK